MKKWIARISIVLVVGLVILVVVNWSLIKQVATFSPIFMPRSGGTPANEAEARLQDIEYLAHLLKYDRSFDEAAKSEFAQLVSRSKQDAATMSLADLYMLGGKATALADNGHTAMSIRHVRLDFNSVGIRYSYFQDGLYVVRALAEHKQLIGGRVIEVDGQPIDTIITTLNAYSGGTAEWRQLHSVILLESPELLHAADLLALPSGYTLTVVDQSGSTLQVELTAQSQQAIQSLATEAGSVEGDGWVHSLQSISTDERPFYLQQPDQLYMWALLPDGGGYVRLQEMWNMPDQTMASFFDENLKPLPDGSLPYLVVDLRANDGGDSTLFVETAKWLPSKVVDDGHLYIVVGSETFSAAVNVMGLLKYYGGEKSIIIGSPMGGRAQYWGERGLPFRLPNSGFQVGYATGYQDWENGCEDHPYCYTQFLKHGVAAGSLAPSHIIEPTYMDYAAGRDVVIEWVHQQERP